MMILFLALVVVGIVWPITVEEYEERRSVLLGSSVEQGAG